MLQLSGCGLFDLKQGVKFLNGELQMKEIREKDSSSDDPYLFLDYTETAIKLEQGQILLRGLHIYMMGTNSEQRPHPSCE